MQRLKMQRILRDASILGVLSAIGVLAPVAVGYTTGPKDAAELQQRAEEELEVAVESRREAIDHEIGRTPRHPWAADYYEGDGLGANIRLSLAPHSGVAATWRGCMGLYGANLGSVMPEPDGALRFAFERANEPGFGGFPERVVPVRWGARRYLIRPTEMASFAAAINAGFEPRAEMHGQFLLADGDERKPVSGLPSLPGPDRARIRLQPVDARILEVGPPERSQEKAGMCDARYPVRLVVDGDAVLRSGDELRGAGRDAPLADVVIREATPGFASGVAKVFESDCGKADADAPREGWRLTTGAYDEASANRAISVVRR